MNQMVVMEMCLTWNCHSWLDLMKTFEHFSITISPYFRSINYVSKLWMMA